MWDIFFISYGESNCESNWRRLHDLHPNAKRIHGITGIDRAHVAVNSLAATPYFWVVDGDNYLLKPLAFTGIPTVDLLMFHAQDPLLPQETTSLGAVKVWRKDSFINTDMSGGDFTLFSVATKQVRPEVFTISCYNATPWEAWKTSFRHSVKLLSIILSTRRSAENREMYLNRWRSTQHSRESNAVWAWRGYLDACQYVEHHDGHMAELNKINDYVWLKHYFLAKYHENSVL